jgi:hypothetical protein
MASHVHRIAGVEEVIQNSPDMSRIRQLGEENARIRGHQLAPVSHEPTSTRS